MLPRDGTHNPPVNTDSTGSLLLIYTQEKHSASTQISVRHRGCCHRWSTAVQPAATAALIRRLLLPVLPNISSSWAQYTPHKACPWIGNRGICSSSSRDGVTQGSVTTDAQEELGQVKHTLAKLQAQSCHSPKVKPGATAWHHKALSSRGAPLSTAKASQMGCPIQCQHTPPTSAAC